MVVDQTEKTLLDTEKQMHSGRQTEKTLLDKENKCTVDWTKKTLLDTEKDASHSSCTQTNLNQEWVSLPSPTTECKHESTACADSGFVQKRCDLSNVWVPLRHRVLFNPQQQFINSKHELSQHSVRPKWSDIKGQAKGMKKCKSYTQQNTGTHKSCPMCQYVIK